MNCRKFKSSLTPLKIHSRKFFILMWGKGENLNNTFLFRFLLLVFVRIFNWVSCHPCWTFDELNLLVYIKKRGKMSTFYSSSVYNSLNELQWVTPSHRRPEIESSRTKGHRPGVQVSATECRRRPCLASKGHSGSLTMLRCSWIYVSLWSDVPSGRWRSRITKLEDGCNSFEWRYIQNGFLPSSFLLRPPL